MHCHISSLKQTCKLGTNIISFKNYKTKSHNHSAHSLIGGEGVGERGGIKIHDFNVSFFNATGNMFILISCVTDHSECLGHINEQIKDPCPHGANILE